LLCISSTSPDLPFSLFILLLACGKFHQLASAIKLNPPAYHQPATRLLNASIELHGNKGGENFMKMVITLTKTIPSRTWYFCAAIVLYQTLTQPDTSVLATSTQSAQYFCSKIFANCAINM